MKKQKILSFNSLKLFVFLLYNVAYALYMTGYIDRIINLVILAFFLLLCMYQYSYNRKKNPDYIASFTSEFKAAIGIIITFLTISIIIQLSHMDFKMYLFSELLYNIIPPTLAFFWINSTNKKEMKKYFYIFFIRTTLYFLLRNWSYLTIQNIKSISWNDSGSSIFETPLAHDFLFLEIIFLYLKKPKVAIISAILCMLSFKRISFILASLILVFYFILGRKQFVKKTLDKEISKTLRIVVFLFICTMPILLNWMVSDSGINYFYSKGIDLDKFTTGRVYVIRYVNKNISYYNGYGSSNSYLKKSNSAALSRIGSIHCDILKLYYEVTIIGVIVFAYCMIYITRKKRIVFLMLLYIFMEMISSHFLDVLSVWNMFFMFVAYVYTIDNKDNLKEDKKLLENKV